MAGPASPSSGGALIFGVVGRIKSLDPGVLLENSSALVTSNIYENLVRFDEASRTVKPHLATSWEASSEFRVWTFYLRKDVKFHDGTSFDAWAVKFNFDRQSDPRHPFHYPSYGRFRYFESLFGTYQELIEHVEVMDLHKVRIKLNQPFPAFLKELALYPFAIVSPAAVKKWKDEYYKNPVGTGPFKFLEWRMPQRVVLVANRDYWGKSPFIERILFQPFEDPVSCLRQLERGQVDVMNDVPLSTIEEVKKIPDIGILQNPGLHFSYLAINCQRFPFNQRSFRLALNHLINRSDIVKNCYANRAVAAVSPIPPRMEGYMSRKGYEYSTKEGSSFLKRSRLPAPSSLVLLYSDVKHPFISDPAGAAERICAFLKLGGLDVKPRKMENGEFTRMLRYGEYDMALWGTIDESGDPDAFMMIPWDTDNAESGGSNVCHYINPSIHSLLWKARRFSEKDPRRAAQYRKIQDCLHDDAPMVPLVHCYQVIAYNRRVQNLQVNVMGLSNLSEVWIRK